MQRHGSSRLPQAEGDEIDRTSKFAFARLVESTGKMEAALALALRGLVNAVPHATRTMLTDNGIQLASRACDVWDSQHILGGVHDEHGIEHPLTEAHHPWPRGQAERMNHTLKEATVRRHHDAGHDEPRAHLQPFLQAHNHARRLKALPGPKS